MLTRYALSLGCQESFSTSFGNVTLWKEHGIYHIRCNGLKKPDDFSFSRITRVSTYKITQARELYRIIVKLIRAKLFDAIAAINQEYVDSTK